MAKDWKIKDLYRIFQQIEATYNISIDTLTKLLSNSTTRILTSEIDPGIEISILTNEEDGLLIKSLNKEVVSDDIYEEEFERNSQVSFYSISLSEAKKIDNNFKIGDEIEDFISLNNLTPGLNTKILNSFKGELIKYKRGNIFEKYHPLIGTQISAKLINEDNRGGAVFELEDSTEAYMPPKMRNQSIPLMGGINQLTIEEVLEFTDKFNRSQVLLSNASIHRLKELFKIEIPEIENGTIEIVSISRIPGERSKISFRQNPEYEGQIDVIGCVLGERGERISTISSRFGGEKFDVILYDEDIKTYLANAIAPSRVVSVNNRSKENDFLIIVPDKQFSLAIGKRGINVKLAVELTGKNIDISSFSKAEENEIEIHWNGNIESIEELQEIENTEGKVARKNRGANKYLFSQLDIQNFEKEIADYQDEITNFESNFNFSNEEIFSQSNKEVSNNGETNITNEIDSFVNNDNYEKTTSTFEKKSSDKEIKKVNDTFKVDEDLIEDVDFSDFDFSDFDDEK